MGLSLRVQRIKGMETSRKNKFLDFIVIAERACNCQVAKG